MSRSDVGKMPHPSIELDHILKNANHLLDYAVEAGIEVEPDIAQRIIAADKQGRVVLGRVGGRLARCSDRQASFESATCYNRNPASVSGGGSPCDTGL